jgi:hypothetical protein
MWAAVYVWIGAVDMFIDALYIPTATFTTIGCGDVTVAQEWRLLVGFEGANGMIIFGWATGHHCCPTASRRVAHPRRHMDRAD